VEIQDFISTDVLSGGLSLDSTAAAGNKFRANEILNFTTVAVSAAWLRTP